MKAAQIPAGTWPPPCQHPHRLAQLSLLQHHSQSQFNSARPQSIPARAAGGAQLPSPHAQTHTHLQISPVICLVNSFSLEGHRVAAKHHQSNQTILNPETSRGLPGLQNPPRLHPSTEGQETRGPALQTPSSTTGTSHLLPVSTPCGHTGPAMLLIPHQGLSPEPALWTFWSTDPQTGPPCTLRLAWVKPPRGSPSHSPTCVLVRVHQPGHVCLGTAGTHSPGSGALPWPSVL